MTNRVLTEDMADKLTPGSARCVCCQCGRGFSSPSGFDHHQTLTKRGDVRCHDPAERGLEQDADGWWHWPKRDAAAIRRLEGLGRRAERTKRVGPVL